MSRSRTTILSFGGSAFDNSTGLRSHLDLPQSVGDFRKDRIARLANINKQIEIAVETATKMISSWLMPVVSKPRKAKQTKSTLFRVGSIGRVLQQIKEKAVQQMKTYDSAVSAAKKMVLSWKAPAVEQTKMELVWNSGDDKYNYGRFEMRQVGTKYTSNITKIMSTT